MSGDVAGVEAVQIVQAIATEPAWVEAPPPGRFHNDIARVILSEDRIASRIRSLASAITQAYAPATAIEPLLLAVTLRGAGIFAADLARAIDLPVELDYITASSYGEATVSSGTVRFLKDLETDIADRHVLIIEDILDSGLTLATLTQSLQARRPASLRVCTLLDKGKEFSLRASPDTLAFTGFLIPDEFVVGYGLDYAQRYRNLPYIGILKPEVYSRPD